MKTLLVSACLLGEKCKYNGGDNALPEKTLAALRERYRLIPVCPETAGGLPIPREPAERRGERVMSQSGRDVTAQYRKGAAYALRLARENACDTALFKERSPSCGSGEIYDGSFTHTVVSGDGVAAETIKAAGMIVCGESEIHSLLRETEA